MKFSQNLPKLRQQHNLSQEQLADKLNVSRQAVSKWESGESLPETDKIIAMCELFDCKMDDLVLSEVKSHAQENNILSKYIRLTNRFNRLIAAGVALCLLGATAMIYIEIFGATTSYGAYYDALSLAIFLFFAAIAVALFITGGLQRANFQRHHPQIEANFTTEELEKSENKFTIGIVLGVTIILMGVITLVFSENAEFIPYSSDLPIAFFLTFLTIGIPILVYTGLQKEKYNLSHYNQQNTPQAQKNTDLVERICGVVMIISTILFICLGFIFEAWHICWLVFPIGGMICGIVSIIFKSSE